MFFRDEVSDKRYQQNNLDERNERYIEKLCNSDDDKFGLLREPKFIVNDGEIAVIINNGNTKFMCKVSNKTGMIIVYHYSNRGNGKKKMRFHKHDREFYDWAFCLSSLNLSHTVYKTPPRKKSMWDKLNNYKNKR